MDDEDIQSIASAMSQPFEFAAYSLCDPKPWGLGYLMWKEQRWEDVRMQLDIDPQTWQLPNFRGVFAVEHRAACVAEVQRCMP